VAVDLSTTVFEVGITDRQWRIIERRRLNRRQFARFLADQPASHVVMEACGTAHYWGRVAHSHGHRVTLLPVRYVKPYLRGNKTDRTDVDALLDAVRTGHIPPVTVKSVAQQEIVALHRIREQWMATRTARINALRGFFREHGIPLPAGPRAAVAAVPTGAEQLPPHLALAVTSVYDDVRSLETRIAGIERQLAAIAKDHDTVQRLLEIPGVGLLTATALVGSVGRISAFRRARQFASWLGLTPREHSSGPRRRLGSITKTGRCLPALSAHPWCSRSAPHSATPGRGAEALDRLATVGGATRRPQGPQQNDHCCRQQTGPHDLGGLGQRHHLHGHAVGRVGRTDQIFSRSCSASEHTIIARQVGPASDEADNIVGRQDRCSAIGSRCAHVHDGQVRARTDHRPDIRPQPISVVA
jgi:transposase